MFLDDIELVVIAALAHMGPPLAVEFGEHHPVMGFEIKAKRIQALRLDHVSNRDLSDIEFRTPKGLDVT